MAMLRASIRWLKARLCTGSLVLVLFAVAWFAISASYRSLHRDPGGVPDSDDPLLLAGDRRLAEHGDYLGPRKVGGGSKGNGGYGEGGDDGFGDEDNVQFCQYPLNVNSASSQTTSDVWEANTESGSCDQRLEKLFYVERNSIRTYEDVGKRFDRCEYRGIKWTTDSGFAYTETRARRYPSPFDADDIHHDFVHVQCYRRTPGRTQEDDGKDRELLPKTDGEGYRDGEEKEEQRRSGRDHGLKRKRRDVATESDEGHRQFGYRDVKDFHRSVVLRNAPRIHGSIGLPDLSENVLSQKPSSDADADDALQSAATDTPQSGAGLSGSANENSDSQLEQKQDNNPRREEADSQALNDGLEAEHGVETKQNRDDLQDVRGHLVESGFWNRGGPPIYEQFLVQVSEEIDAKKMAEQLALERGSKGFRMNVLVLALDSISRASFEENFRESNEYLKSELDAAVMNGYNSIGDAATAFVIPLITGDLCALTNQSINQ